MPSTTELKQLSPQVRRRNRRLGWALFFLALAAMLWTPYAAHHGWIYPEDTTFAFPHWIK
ncbi:MAG TPA: hypothetical protein VFP94_06635 [Terriglobales bacterium]|nr:hypothetical protein [Terriglobales bacterium]